MKRPQERKEDFMTDYQIPQVWEWDQANDDLAGNRPTAGARFDQSLPVGQGDLQIYSLGTPNGIKVAIMVQELLALGKISDQDYDLFKIKIGEGDQFGSDFVAINPNSKIPAMVDRSQTPALPIFESGSILLYLAEKYQALLPDDLTGRTQTLNWVFWQTGTGPYVGGGFGHFFHYAPTPQKYPIDRFTMETKRQLDILDQWLGDHAYMVGENYTIADIMIWSWYGQLIKDDLYEGAAQFLAADTYKNLGTWADKIAARPAVQAALEMEYQEI